MPAGYVVFAPVRSGHGYSPGAYILDAINQTQASQGGEAASRVAVQLLETQQLNDQLAGLAYARRLPFVDSNRIAVAGCSFGGIETLLGAERGVGYKAAISISPGAQSWERNPVLQQRLVQAVQRIAIPVQLLQPPKDASLQPSRVLGVEAQCLRKPFTVKVYPDVGPEQEKTHCFGGVAAGIHVWAEDAKAFLAANLGFPRVGGAPSFPGGGGSPGSYQSPPRYQPSSSGYSGAPQQTYQPKPAGYSQLSY